MLFHLKFELYNALFFFSIIIKIPSSGQNTYEEIILLQTLDQGFEYLPLK